MLPDTLVLTGFLALLLWLGVRHWRSRRKPFPITGNLFEWVPGTPIRFETRAQLRLREMGEALDRINR